MGFRYNQSKATNFSGIKSEGVYECIIVNATEKTTQNGKTFLSVSAVIRNDVEQKYKNAYIFHSLWKRKKPTEMDMQVNGYSFGQVMALGKAAGLPDGKDYDGLESFCNDLKNRPVRITLKHSEYKGQLREEVRYIEVTKFPDVKHIFKATASNDGFAPQTQTAYASQQQQTVANKNSYSSYSNNNANDISDEDLPF